MTHGPRPKENGKTRLDLTCLLSESLEVRDMVLKTRHGAGAPAISYDRLEDLVRALQQS